MHTSPAEMDANLLVRGLHLLPLLVSEPLVGDGGTLLLWDWSGAECTLLIGGPSMSFPSLYSNAAYSFLDAMDCVALVTWGGSSDG